MLRYSKEILYVIMLSLFVSSCVTPKVYNSLISDHEILKDSYFNNEKKLLESNNSLEEELNRINLLLVQINKLKSDSIQNGKLLNLLQSKYNSLSDTYDLLVSKNSRYISEKAIQTKQLLERLEKVQSELFSKEEELNITAIRLIEKQEKLQMAQSKLAVREKRVIDLEKIIGRKDSLVTSLKNSISKALIGIEGEGLSIEKRNGKVYISLEEDLLFASGQYKVNNSGIKALNKLSIVLSNQRNLEILVEGHTDSIPVKTNGFVKDNWDLSVMRATNVVKVLTQNKNLNPLKVIASGRAEFMPISTNKTISGRSANRRIEMILSPNLDDLFNLLN